MHTQFPPHVAFLDIRSFIIVGIVFQRLLFVNTRWHGGLYFTTTLSVLRNLSATAIAELSYRNTDNVSLDSIVASKCHTQFLIIFLLLWILSQIFLMKEAPLGLY